MSPRAARVQESGVPAQTLWRSLSPDAIWPGISHDHARRAPNIPFSAPQRLQTEIPATAPNGGYLKSILNKPGGEGFLRRKHVADVRFWARLRTQKRSDKGIDAGHVGVIASGASYTPL